MGKSKRRRLPWAVSSLAAAVSAVVAGFAGATPTVTYILSPNDDGHGDYSPGQFAVYVIDSAGDNAGIGSFNFDIQGFSGVTNVAPEGFYDNGLGAGGTVTIGFTLARSALNIDPVRASQDTISGTSSAVLVYGFGQTAGNLDSKAPAGSTGGTGKVQTIYDSKLLLATGTFTNASSLIFTPGSTSDRANVFGSTSSGTTSAATVFTVAANTDTYIGPSGSFSSSANWTPVVPVLYDQALIIGSASNVTVTYDTTATTASLGSITIDGTGSATRTLSQTGNTLTTTHEFVGVSGTGTLSISGGVHNVTGNGSNGLSIGVNAGSHGAVNLSNGTLNVSYNETIGSAGTAVVTQSGGVHTIGSGLAIGSLGSFALSGGSVTSPLTTNGGSFSATGGMASLGALSGGGSLSVGGGAGTSSIAVTSFSQGAVTVANSGLLSVATNSTQFTNTANTLTVTGTGTLDLANNAVKINSGSLSTIGGYLRSGYANGYWTGTGIRSSTAAAYAAANGPGVRSIGYVGAADGITSGPGTSLTGSQILIKNTLAGDANLDGTVDFNDFNLLSAHYMTTGNDWATGDFNYSANGLVDFSDFNLLSNNYLQNAPAVTPLVATAKLTAMAKPALPGPWGNLSSNKMEIDVNSVTGDVVVYGNAATRITGIEISSASGSLIGANAQTDGTFSLLLNNTNNDIQLGRLGSTTINGGVDLGDIYNATMNFYAPGDLTFSYGQNGATLTGQSVVYTDLPEPSGIVMAVLTGGLLLNRRRKKGIGAATLPIIN